MALIPCPDCGRQVSLSATICPGCGKPVAPPVIKRRPLILRFILGVFRVLILLMKLVVILAVLAGMTYGGSQIWKYWAAAEAERNAQQH